MRTTTAAKGARRTHRRGESPNDAEIDRLARVAKRLLVRAGAEGVTMADVRLYAGIAPVKSRKLSYLHAVFPRADAVATCLFRRSPIPQQRGIPHLIWVARQHYNPKRHGPAPVAQRRRRAA